MTERTALYHWHLKHQAKMVPFAGYDMPLQYEGIVAEHKATRAKAAFFDVSHMGQLLARGAGVAEALEKLLPADIIGLAVNQQRYSFLTNDQGGIDDDLMVSRRGADEFYIVVNAACKAADFATLKAALPAGSIDWWPNRALIAVQGPEAVALLGQLNGDIPQLAFMRGGAFEILGSDCWVSRSGYTGEDGVEISIDNQQAAALCDRLMELGAVPAGLGARDSLRLEAGLCLYGNDINGTTSPIEANLLWAIQKVRRPGGDRAGGYRGAAVIEEHINNGAPRRLVGLTIDGKLPIRSHSKLFSNGQEVGEVTSGGFGPSLDRPIAMALVQSKFATVGTALSAEVRGREIALTVCELPFIKKGYKK